MSTLIPWDYLCRRCGCEPSGFSGLCGDCQADADFDNCDFCHGTECTRECEQDEDDLFTEDVA